MEIKGNQRELKPWERLSGFFDMEQQELVKKMKAYRYEGIQEEYFKELRQAAEEFEVDVCEKILEKLEQEIDGILD